MHNPMTDYQQYLHQQALKIAAQFRKTESELLDILQKIETKRVYRHLGYASLFTYAVQALKLSDAVAYSFIQVARKSKEVPELKQAIAQGDITVSKATRVASVITIENKNELLALAKNASKHELEKMVAKINPRMAVIEKTKYVTEQRLELKLGISEELMKQLRRVQDLLSTNQRQAVTLEETLGSITTEYLERHDPIKKAHRAQAKLQASENTTESSSELCLGRALQQDESKKQVEQQHALSAIDELVMHAARQSEPNTQVTQRPAIPAAIQHAVVLRDQGQCSYVDAQGNRCKQQRWLHFHHVTPKARSGEDRIENLKLLCAGHHQVVHQLDR